MQILWKFCDSAGNPYNDFRLCALDVNTEDLVVNIKEAMVEKYSVYLPDNVAPFLIVYKSDDMNDVVKE